jgi:hypothetical protein
MIDTQQVNLRLSAEHAELVRLFVQRLREGGPSYQREVRVFLLQPYSPRYMSISELDRRFGEILRRIEALEAEVGSASAQERREDGNPGLCNSPVTGRWMQRRARKMVHDCALTSPLALVAGGRIAC